MGRRVLAGLAVLAVALAGPGGCSREPGGSELLPGESVPSAWIREPARPGSLALVWLFRTEDCLACMKVDYSLRRVQARYGETVPLVAVHVGAPEAVGVARAYMAKARLAGSLVNVSSSEFQDRFGRAGIPSLFLVDGGEIVWSSAAPAGTAGIRTQPLDSTVTRFLQRKITGPEIPSS